MTHINKLFALMAMCAAALFFTGCSPRTIPPGSVGVKFNGVSGVSNQILKPEVVWVSWWNEDLIVYPTNIQQASFVRTSNEGDRAGDDSIRATTREGALLPVDVSVSYRIEANPGSVKKVFDTFGIPASDPTHPLAMIQREHIRWATIVAVNEVAGRSSIFDLLSTHRAKFGPDVKALLEPKLEEWGLKLEDVLIREIHPPQEIVDRINEQQGKKAELEQVRIEKQKALTEAKTTIIQAQQMAEQNRLLSLQGEEAIALKKLERKRLFYERWNGKTPLVDSDVIPQP